MKRNRLFLIPATAVALSLLLSGCGASDDEKAGPNSGESSVTPEDYANELPRNESWAGVPADLTALDKTSVTLNDDGATVGIFYGGADAVAALKQRFEREGYTWDANGDNTEVKASNNSYKVEIVVNDNQTYTYTVLAE